MTELKIRRSTERNDKLLSKRFGRIGQESIVCPFCREDFWEKVGEDIISCSTCGCRARVTPQGDNWAFIPLTS